MVTGSLCKSPSQVIHSAQSTLMVSSCMLNGAFTWIQQNKCGAPGKESMLVNVKGRNLKGRRIGTFAAWNRVRFPWWFDWIHSYITVNQTKLRGESGDDHWWPWNQLWVLPWLIKSLIWWDFNNPLKEGRKSRTTGIRSLEGCSTFNCMMLPWSRFLCHCLPG